MGWRIPFILGMLIGPVGWYLRRRMEDVPMKNPRRPSFKAMLMQRRRTLGLGILLMAAPAAGIYLLVYYMPMYLVGTLHMPAMTSLLSALFFQCAGFHLCALDGPHRRSAPR